MENTPRKARVVVIDDNRGFRLAAETFLRALDSVEFAGAAPDGVQGIELVSTARADAAIVDLYMPGLNGFEVVRRLRSEHEDLGIVVVSMNVDQGVRSEAYRLDADAVVPKVDFVGDISAVLEAVVLKRGRGNRKDAAPEGERT